jgi:hypothetical protein
MSSRSSMHQGQPDQKLVCAVSAPESEILQASFQSPKGSIQRSLTDQADDRLADSYKPVESLPRRIPNRFEDSIRSTIDELLPNVCRLLSACGRYDYPLTPGANASCGGANLWASLSVSSGIFCPGGSYCASTSSKDTCDRGYRSPILPSSKNIS